MKSVCLKINYGENKIKKTNNAVFDYPFIILLIHHPSFHHSFHPSISFYISIVLALLFCPSIIYLSIILSVSLYLSIHLSMSNYIYPNMHLSKSYLSIHHLLFYLSRSVCFYPFASIQIYHLIIVVFIVLYIHIFVCLSFCSYIHPSISFCPSIVLSIHICIHPFISFYLYRSIYPYIHLSVCLCYLSIRISVHPSFKNNDLNFNLFFKQTDQRPSED